MWCARRFAEATTSVAAFAVFAFLVGRPVAADFPTGWTGLFDATGRCFYAVPPRWKIDDSFKLSGPLAASPDGRVTATITWSELHSWSFFTARLRRTLQPIAVFEDSVNRFWVEYRGSRLSVDQLIAVPNPGGTCTFEVEASEPVSEETRRTLITVIGTVTSIR
jgi:hypothetical protein